MSDALTLTFHALADPTRRQILARLTKGEATVAELADPLPISQPAVSKHLKVLEKAGLVERRSEAQMRFASLRGKPLEEAVACISEFHRAWEESFSRLDDLLEEVIEAERRKPRR